MSKEAHIEFKRTYMILKLEIIDAIYNAFFTDTHESDYLKFDSTKKSDVKEFNRKNGNVLLDNGTEDQSLTLNDLDVPQLLYLLRRIEKKEYTPIL